MQPWPSTADQYIIAYKSYRQTLLLSPLKSLQVEALWVITHLQQQLAQLKLSEDTVVAELEPQVTRVANGAGVVSGMEGYAICRIKFSLHLLFNAIEI